jgi:hypothetical protein
MAKGICNSPMGKPKPGMTPKGGGKKMSGKR